MRANWLILLVLLPDLGARAADVCNPADLFGPFAFQLTGSTEISGAPKPAVSLGRISFDERGSLSGTASVTFRGLLLGNPVTGSYEAKPDCSVTWKLQDDSGGFQSFSGTLSSDGTSVPFKQTDPGGAQHGIMKKLPAACSAAGQGRGGQGSGARYNEEPPRRVLGGGSGAEVFLYCLRRHHADATRPGSARRVRQGYAGHFPEWQLSGGERLLRGLRVDASRSGRSGGRPTFAHEHAWVSGQRRQGNSRLPDRSGSHGVGTPHLRRKVKPRQCRRWQVTCTR